MTGSCCTSAGADRTRHVDVDDYNPSCFATITFMISFVPA